MFKKWCSKQEGNSTACGMGGGAYGLAVIGALVYYLQQATDLTSGLIGVLKAIVWPAFLIYRLLGFLGM